MKLIKLLLILLIIIALTVSFVPLDIYYDKVAELFPESKELTKLGMNGYVGTVICDKNKKIIGIIWLLSRQRLMAPKYWKKALDIIAAKAGVEIERLHAEEKLKHLATYDQLTKIPNRYLLDIELKKHINEAQRFGHKVAVLFFDLDNFKKINDTLGHKYGDLLLYQVAQKINSHIREYDILARFGGDEFVLLLSKINNKNEILQVVEKIFQRSSQHYNLEGTEVSITFSVGISIYPDDGDNMDRILRNSDIALYRVKESGRNNYQFYS
jgi:diguanylate cyclase (GGDEF)-like protein